jgi:hypothetical protein
MASTPLILIAIVASIAALGACKTQNAGADAVTGGSTADAGASTGGTADTGTSTGGTTASDGTTGGTTGGGTGTGTSVPALISVNLQNVLNDLSISLQVDRNSIPVTAQVPIDVAAAVCGVSVDVLAASLASGTGSCTATTTSAQLTQVVQQQISTGGSVTGGDQTTTVPNGNTM